VGLRDLGTQGVDGIGTFPCPKIDSDDFGYNDGVALCCRTEKHGPPSEDNELSICEDTVHCSYTIRPLLFGKICDLNVLFCDLCPMRTTPPLQDSFTLSILRHGER
jgi:hypothetical protein